MPLVRLTVPVRGLTPNTALTVPLGAPVRYAGAPVGEVTAARALDGKLELELIVSELVLGLALPTEWTMEEIPWV